MPEMKFASWTSRMVVDAPMFNTIVPAMVYVPPPVIVEFALPLKVRVDPATALNVPALLKFPPMLSDLPLLMVSEPAAAMVKLAQTSPAALMVIAMPAGMVTTSIADGTVPRDQFAGVSQGPDPTAVLLPARTLATANERMKDIRRDRPVL